MSGLKEFFLPFLGCSRATFTSPNNAADVNGNVNADDTNASNVSRTGYNQSLLTATNANTTIIELEEQKTMIEWKEKYCEIILKFILFRMYTSAKDEASGDEDDNLYLTSREDMYHAAKFGFIPMSAAEEYVSQTQSPQINSANEDSNLINHQDSYQSQLGIETQAIHLLNSETSNGNEGIDAQPPITFPLHDNPNKVHNSIGRTMFPCVKDLDDHPINSISEITLTVSSISIHLASILKIWKQQRSKPPKPPSANATMPFPYDWIRKGPLCFNFKRVVSLEVMEWELEIGTKKDIRNISRKAFGQKTRRIRVFFYNLYADAITSVIEKAEKNMRSANSTGGTCTRTDSKKTCLKDQMMVAFRNIPARCIFPMYTQDRKSVV